MDLALSIFSAPFHWHAALMNVPLGVYTSGRCELVVSQSFATTVW